jgi:hypothetical protein
VSQNFLDEDERYVPTDYFFGDVPAYKPISRLSNNIGESMRMMADIQRLREELPGTDCGSCGAPTCRALAEDIVKGQANIDACVIRASKLRCEGCKTDKDEE